MITSGPVHAVRLDQTFDGSSVGEFETGDVVKAVESVKIGEAFPQFTLTVVNGMDGSKSVTLTWPQWSQIVAVVDELRDTLTSRGEITKHGARPNVNDICTTNPRR